MVLEPVAGRIEDLEARAERLGLQADPDTVQEVREGFAQSWRVVEFYATNDEGWTAPVEDLSE